MDYITTHCAPNSVQDVISGGGDKRDALTNSLEKARQRCSFKYWFYGHYHDNGVVEKKYVLLYEQIIRLK